MEPPIRIQSHIGANGTLHIEGLHQMAGKDVIVVLTPRKGDIDNPPFELENYSASMMGESVADRIKAISQTCSNLPVLDDRPADEILGYDDIGLPE